MRRMTLVLALAAGLVAPAFAQQAEIAYRRLAQDWQPKPKSGAGATRGRASSKPTSGKQRGRASVPNPAL